MCRRLALAFSLAALACPAGARAEERFPPAWPARLNVSMPFGVTFGREKLDGFTWGFRPALLAYPTSTARSVGAGVFGEYLIDADTHAMWSLGALSTVPLVRIDFMDFRVGGLAAVRGSAEAGDGRRRFLAAMTAELAAPAYLYDFRVGLRADGTFDDRGLSASSLLLEVDIVALVGLVAYGSSR